MLVTWSGFRGLECRRRLGKEGAAPRDGALDAEIRKHGGGGEVHKKLQEASNTVDQGLVRTRAIGRKLRNVQELGSPEHAEPTILEDEIEEVEHTVNELASVG